MAIILTDNKIIKDRFVSSLKSIGDSMTSSFLVNNTKHDVSDAIQFVSTGIATTGATISDEWDYFLLFTKNEASMFIAEFITINMKETFSEKYVVVAEYIDENFEHGGFMVSTIGLPDYNYAYKNFRQDLLDKLGLTAESCSIVNYSTEIAKSWALFFSQCEKVADDNLPPANPDKPKIGDSFVVPVSAGNQENLHGFAIYLIPLIIPKSSLIEPALISINQGDIMPDDPIIGGNVIQTKFSESLERVSKLENKVKQLNVNAINDSLGTLKEIRENTKATTLLFENGYIKVPGQFEYSFNVRYKVAGAMKESTLNFISLDDISEFVFSVSDGKVNLND